MKIKKNYIILGLILLLAFFLRIYNYSKYSYAFYDEGVHSYFGIQSSKDLVLGTMYQPPVLFQIYGFFYSIFKDVMVFRLLNIFFSVTSIILCFIWVKNNFSIKEALLVCLLLATTTIHIEYSQFLNQDSLLMCLGLLSLILIDYSKKSKNLLFFIFSGVVIGIGVFTKFTFFVFNGVIILYLFFFQKMKNIKKYICLFLGEGIIILIFLMPYIIVFFNNSSSIYSITNYFQAYSAENLGSSNSSIFDNISFYSAGMMEVLGFGLILLLYSLFFNKLKETKYNFLILWIILVFLFTLVFLKQSLRYLFIQNLMIIPLLIYISKSLFFEKRTFYILLSLILSYNLYFCYNFINNNQMVQETVFRYIDNDAFNQVLYYLNQNAPKNSIIMSNEPYLFLSVETNFPITSNYEPHISCPNTAISYFVLVYSKANNYNGFDPNLVNNYPQYYSLENKVESENNIFYIFKVNGSDECKTIVSPIKTGLYLSDII
ncbi:MAG: glycosyltransferase family 39 protein [Candidatus Nanoarchaeia archaeon]|jgi:4-amino-4-deoxy-L-arabinose transferase-like glycosyltransferase